MNSFRLEIPQSDLDDLHARLERIRWADELPGAEWSYGVPLDHLRELVDYWRSGFDWRAQEARLNAHPQFVTTIDGQRVQFINVCSPEPNVLPLICTRVEPIRAGEPLRTVRRAGAASRRSASVLPRLALEAVSNRMRVKRSGGHHAGVGSLHA